MRGRFKNLGPLTGLGDTIILDLAWALDAVYGLFDRKKAYSQLRRLRGRFNRELLASIVWQKHDEAEQRIFLHLMSACGVRFIARKGDEERGIEPDYIAPDLLPDRREIEDELVQRHWNDAEADVEVSLDYAFLHHGELRSVIAKIGDAAVDAFRRRIVPIVLSDARIDGVAERAKWALHWQRQTEEMKAVVKELDPEYQGESTVRDLKLMGDYGRHVADILNLICDTLFPRDFERMREEDFAEVVALLLPNTAASGD